MSRTLWDRTAAAPKEPKVFMFQEDGKIIYEDENGKRVYPNEPKADARPIRIERGPKGVRFFLTGVGTEVTKEHAVALMRAYKHGDPGRGVKPHPTPKAKPVRRVQRTTFHAALYRTPFGSPERSKLIAECHGETFAAMALKLASLCMQHTSDNRSAVEVVIEGSR